MERRSDKYDSFEKTPEKRSRVQKNRCLYDEMNNKIGYEEITNFESNTEIDLSSLNVKNPSREDYQKIKEYKDLLGERQQKKIERIEKEFKPKTFDINVVLEEAKKNRKSVDELEQKRNLKDEEYSVLSNLNKKYLHKKDFTEEDDEELKELIDTITSKTLADEIKDEEEKELLSELLATTIDIKLESELSQEEINKLYNHKIEKEDIEEIEKDLDESEENQEDGDNNLDNSFYTKSMDLSKEDLFEDEKEEIEKVIPKKKRKGLKIVLLSLVLLVMLAIVAYFVLKHFGITFN